MARQFASPPGALERRFGEINSRRYRAGLQPLQIIGSHADTNFQNAFPGRFLEPGKLADVRLEFIAGSRVGVEILAISKVTRTARVGVPEIANIRLQFAGRRGLRHDPKSDTSTR